jgi:hypothetical protein
MPFSAPKVGLAQTSAEQRQQEEKKEKKEKKATAKKQTKPDDKAQKKNDPKAGVNQAFDSFKKDLGSAKGEGGSARKSTNDAWDKSK